MIEILSTLMRGSAARRKDAVTGHYAIELIEERTREADAALLSAKSALAGLIARERKEARSLEMIRGRVRELEKRARAALEGGNEDLAAEAASVIADLENEATGRERALAELRSRITRMQFSVEKTHRRLIDLKQGVIAARAVRAEHRAQRGMTRGVDRTSAIREAEALVARVLNEEDPLETEEILDEIDDGLSGKAVTEKMAEAGYGAPDKVRAADVLARLRVKP